MPTPSKMPHLHRTPADWLHYLTECFFFNAVKGTLIWRMRPAHHFPGTNAPEKAAAKWNALHAGTAVPSTLKSLPLNYTRHAVPRLIYQLVMGAAPEKVGWIDTLTSLTVTGWACLHTTNLLRPAQRRPNSTDGTFRVLGVIWNKPLKHWDVRIRLPDGTHEALGSYTDLVEAMAVRKLGEFKYGFFPYDIKTEVTTQTLADRLASLSPAPGRSPDQITALFQGDRISPWIALSPEDGPSSEPSDSVRVTSPASGAAAPALDDDTRTKALSTPDHNRLARSAREAGILKGPMRECDEAFFAAELERIKLALSPEAARAKREAELDAPPSGYTGLPFDPNEPDDPDVAAAWDYHFPDDPKK